MSKPVILFVRIDSCPRCGLPRYKLTSGGKAGAYGRLFHMNGCSKRRAAEMRKDIRKADAGQEKP